MSYSTVVSRGFSDKTLIGNLIGKLHYERPSTCRVCIRNNIAMDDELWNNTTMEGRL